MITKKILITGKNSYIGNAFAQWMGKYQQECILEFLSLRDNYWESDDFSKYDVVLHLAGIAHVEHNKNMEQEYYKINRDLAIECCQKAKMDGVKQFIFLSSIIIYGEKRTFRNRIITDKTMPKPTGAYGNSKLMAEEGIMSLADNNFKVTIIRTPMVYGKNSKGNYRRLSKLACLCPVFPQIHNQRSMIYVDNLCELIRLVIKLGREGILFPQNKEYVTTYKLVEKIALCHNKKIKLTRLFNPIVYCLLPFVRSLSKVFGSLVYEHKLSSYENLEYQIVNFEDSIIQTEIE